MHAWLISLVLRAWTHRNSTVWMFSLLCEDNAGWGTVGRMGVHSSLTQAETGLAGPLAVSLSQAPTIHQREQHPEKVCRVSSCTSRRWELDWRGSGFKSHVGEDK